LIDRRRYSSLLDVRQSGWLWYWLQFGSCKNYAETGSEQATCKQDLYG
jgi:hypothetical protein